MSKKQLSLHRILNHRPLVAVARPVRLGTALRATQREYRQALWGRK